MKQKKSITINTEAQNRLCQVNNTLSGQGATEKAECYVYYRNNVTGMPVTIGMVKYIAIEPKCN